MPLFPKSYTDPVAGQFRNQYSFLGVLSFCSALGGEESQILELFLGSQSLRCLHGLYLEKRMYRHDRTREI